MSQEWPSHDHRGVSYNELCVEEEDGSFVGVEGALDLVRRIEPWHHSLSFRCPLERLGREGLQSLLDQIETLCRDGREGTTDPFSFESLEIVRHFNLNEETPTWILPLLLSAISNATPFPHLRQLSIDTHFTLENSSHLDCILFDLRLLDIDLSGSVCTSAALLYHIRLLLLRLSQGIPLDHHGIGYTTEEDPLVGDLRVEAQGLVNEILGLGRDGLARIGLNEFAFFDDQESVATLLDTLSSSNPWITDFYSASVCESQRPEMVSANEAVEETTANNTRLQTDTRAAALRLLTPSRTLLFAKPTRLPPLPLPIPTPTSTLPPRRKSPRFLITTSSSSLPLPYPLPSPAPSSSNPNSNPPSPLLSLPPEVLLNILEHLSDGALSSKQVMKIVRWAGDLETLERGKEGGRRGWEVYLRGVDCWRWER